MLCRFRWSWIRVLAHTFLLCLASLVHAADKPNIVLIVADDLGYCDSELYGCDAVPTPNLMRIANEGVLFTAGYVTSPVCSPSRASLLTGRYQQRFGHEFLPSKPDSGLPVSETTLADTLGQAGYLTAMVGKWHLGSAPQFHPTRRGFGQFFGMMGGATDYLDPTDGNARSDRTVKKPWPGRGARGVYRGTEEVDEDRFLTEAFTQEAVQFIEQNKTRPFFLYLPHLAVHQPLQVTRAYYDRFPHIKDESTRIYAAMTAAMDDSIGLVLDALERNKLASNTLLIFVSDNGAGVADYCTNAPFRLGKQTLFEGGVRVPFAMRWPGHIPQGEQYSKPVSTLDIFPTVMAAAGRSAGAGSSLDGVDLMPHLTGLQAGNPHDVLYWRSGKNWAIREGHWKLIHAAGRDWLYNLTDDTGEQSNLAGELPGVVEKLKGLYNTWSTKMADPAWPPAGMKKGLQQFSVDGVGVDWPV